MCTAVDNGEIIILSDDDDDDSSCQDSSVVIMEKEDVKKSECVLPLGSLDEDLVVTFSRRAEVLPHARYDCPIHPFTATDNEIGAPVAGNQLICDQCFCYICDKLASTCVTWCLSGACHCNSHKRSVFWMNLRNGTLLGGLQNFNLTVSDVDCHLRHAETMLQNFRAELSALFLSFVKGRIITLTNQSLSQQQDLIHDYTPVYECVSSFLDKADGQDGRAAAIMRLGASEDFVRHYQVSGSYILQSPLANVVEAKRRLLQRVVASLQRQMVMASFSSNFTQKLQNFYRRFHFSAELRSMKNSLCVRPWDDILLVSVLKGQNVSGVRKDKGKKEVLMEQMSVVLLRTELLQHQHRYRELCRYLRVVQTDEPKHFQQLQDLIPLFMCMEGDFSAALHSLFPSVNSRASRLTPQLFLLYFRIFETATAPKLMVSQDVQLCISEATWETIKGAEPLRRTELVRFALRVHRCSCDVYTDSQCWIRLLEVVNTPFSLPPPSLEFLHEANDVVNSILHNKSGSNLQIPRFLVYPDQALLLLVTGALAWRIVHAAALRPVLHVLKTFKENVWALRWLAGQLSEAGRLGSFLLEIQQEVESTTGGRLLHSLHQGGYVRSVSRRTNEPLQDRDCLLPSLESILPSLMSTVEAGDHTYCIPMATRLRPPTMMTLPQPQLAHPLSH